MPKPADHALNDTHLSVGRRGVDARVVLMLVRVSGHVSCDAKVKKVSIPQGDKGEARAQRTHGQRREGHERWRLDEPSLGVTHDVPSSRTGQVGSLEALGSLHELILDLLAL